MRDGGGGGGEEEGAYLFSKLDKWRRGVHMKFEAETIAFSTFFLIRQGKEGIAVTRRRIRYYGLVLYQSLPTRFPTRLLPRSISSNIIK